MNPIIIFEFVIAFISILHVTVKQETFSLLSKPI